MSRSRAADHPIALIASLCLTGALGCSSGFEAITACDDVRGISVTCGFQNPEDLALLEDGRTLVVSQFGGMDSSRAGSLALFDVEENNLVIAYQGQADVASAPAAPANRGWGADDCPSPPGPSFNPHGIDVAPLPDGRMRLLAVNHGGRESVEIFEILHAAGRTAIEWRGCAIPPDDTFMNDVVSLPNGGFLVTHMMSRGWQMLDLPRAMLGWDTGLVLEWQRGAGFSEVPGTAAPFPNGIELSEDGREIYLNVYMGSEVRRISRESGETLARASVARPDNLSWARDGRLLVASHTGTSIIDQMNCMRLSEGSCPIAFEILALDPVSLEGGAIFGNEGAPMGAATVAVDLGEEIIMGTFAGDRVIRARPVAR